MSEGSCVDFTILVLFCFLVSYISEHSHIHSLAYLGVLIMFCIYLYFGESVLLQGQIYIFLYASISSPDVTLFVSILSINHI